VTPATTRRARRVLTIVVFCVSTAAWTLFVKAEGFHEPLESDAGLFAYTAAQMLDGATLFRETPFAFRPPGVYVVDALAMAALGKTSFAIRVGDAVWTVFTALVLAWVLRRLVSTAALAGAIVLFVVVSSAPALDGRGNTSEGYLVLFSIAGVGVLLHAAEAPRPVALALAGSMFGLALLFKQTAGTVALLVVPLVVVFWLRNGVSRRAVALGLALLAVGVSLPLLVLVGYTAAHGTVRDMAYEVVWMPLQAAMAGRNAAAEPRLFARTMIVVGYFMWPITGLALVSCVLWSTRCMAFTRAHAVLVGWLAGALLGAVAAGIGAGHYYLPAIAPLVAIGALSLHQLAARAARAAGSVQIAVGLTVALALIPVVWRDVSEFRSRFWHYLDHPRAPTPIERVAEFVRLKTRPDDYVYGYGSHKYVSVAFHAGRRFATRHVSPKIFDGTGYERGQFPHPSTLAWMPREIRRDLMDHRPAIILGVGDADLPEALYGDLGDWIRRNYEVYRGSGTPTELRETGRDVLVRIGTQNALR
jgi:4-amino-4-deoxy-L-arabinose transferase-like glycosyltransferase